MQKKFENNIFYNIFANQIARMAELVDAHDSGSCVLKDVQVRVLFRALKHNAI